MFDVVHPQRVRERPRDGSTALDGQPRTLGLPPAARVAASASPRHLSDGHDPVVPVERLVRDANGRAGANRARLVSPANHQQVRALHPRAALHGDARQRKVRRLRVVAVEPRQPHPRAAAHRSQPPDRHLRAPRVTGTGAPGAQPDVHIPGVVVDVDLVRPSTATTASTDATPRAPSSLLRNRNPALPPAAGGPEHARRPRSRRQVPRRPAPRSLQRDGDVREVHRRDGRRDGYANARRRGGAGDAGGRPHRRRRDDVHDTLRGGDGGAGDSATWIHLHARRRPAVPGPRHVHGPSKVLLAGVLRVVFPFAISPSRVRGDHRLPTGRDDDETASSARVCTLGRRSDVDARQSLRDEIEAARRDGEGAPVGDDERRADVDEDRRGAGQSAVRRARRFARHRQSDEIVGGRSVGESVGRRRDEELTNRRGPVRRAPAGNGFVDGNRPAASRKGEGNASGGPGFPVPDRRVVEGLEAQSQRRRRVDAEDGFPHSGPDDSPRGDGAVGSVDDLVLAIARQRRLYGQRRMRDEPPRAFVLTAAERVAGGDARVGFGHDHDEPGAFRPSSFVVARGVVRIRAAGSEPRALRVEAALLVLSTQGTRADGPQV